MSARTPIILPENWSTSLKVRRSRSCPVPVSSDSRYSSMGGITSWYPCTRNSSRSFARIRSMRCACGGRMSSNFSGRSQLRIGFPPPARLADEKTDLSVSELRDAAEGIAPKRRKKERQQTLDNQHEGKRHDKRRAHSLAALSRVSEIPEELGIGVEHDHVALVLEARPVGVEAAVEGVELGILVEGARVDGGRLRIALAFDALGVAVGASDDDLAFAVGFGTDLFGLRKTLRPALSGNGLPFRVHASIDCFAYLLPQLDTLDAYIDDLDAVTARVASCADLHNSHDLLALTRHHVVHRALGELVLKGRFHCLLQLRHGGRLVALNPLVVLPQILDPPFDEKID